MSPPVFDHRDAGTPEATWAASTRLAGLPRLDLAGLGSLVVLSAHPDDESLGAGGLVALATAAGADVDVVVASCGERSHPQSPTHSPRQLSAVRRLEVRAAVAALGPAVRLHQLDLPDGALSRAGNALDAALARVVVPGAWIAAPWRGDGHPDHTAVGAAAARAAAARAGTLLEFPVWAWHWADPDGDDLPWARLRMLPLPPAARAAKRAAMAAHTSQVLPLSGAPGDEAVVAPTFAAHFERDTETYLLVSGEER